MFDEYDGRTWAPGDDISPQQTELATSLRVPFLTSAYPRWNYITGIVISEDDLGRGIVPTEDEIRQIAAQLQSYYPVYRPGFHRAMTQFAPYDIDSGANLGYYRKHPDGGWFYRKRTWESPPWWPSRAETMPLADILERNFRGWSNSAAT